MRNAEWPITYQTVFANRVTPVIRSRLAHRSQWLSRNRQLNEWTIVNRTLAEPTPNADQHFKVSEAILVSVYQV